MIKNHNDAKWRTLTPTQKRCVYTIESISSHDKITDSKVGDYQFNHDRLSKYSPETIIVALNYINHSNGGLKTNE